MLTYEIELIGIGVLIGAALMSCLFYLFSQHEKDKERRQREEDAYAEQMRANGWSLTTVNGHLTWVPEAPDTVHQTYSRSENDAHRDMSAVHELNTQLGKRVQ